MPLIVILLSEEDLENLAKELGPVTEDLMKIKMAPWIKGYVSDMNDLYTELEIDKLEHKPKTTEKRTPFKDYTELFQDCTANSSQVKRGKGKRVLVKADPGNGKTTFVGKVAWDWAKGFFTTFTIVFLVSMKLVQPGDVLENVIIQQNPVLEGLGVTDHRLKNILETFGQRCLIILDGFDEYTDVSGNKEHKDTIKMLKGQKFLRCNVLLTSRPHCISNVEEHFQTVVRINGFSEEHAGEFVGKILNDAYKVQSVLEFECFTSNCYSFEYQHKCPILLLFVSFLVNEKEIDISKKDTTLGEIYTRLVRCLYRKFTFRKGLQFKNQGFFELLQCLGKIAWETLVCRKYSMQRQDIEMIDEYIFDYGLIIGHEDYRLRGSETADIFITFVHRTIQEFLGSFYFVQVLSKGKQIDSLLPHGCKEPICMSNQMIIEFCIWFLSDSSNSLPLVEISIARQVLKSIILQHIDFPQINLCELSLLYPSLFLPMFVLGKNGPTSKFCSKILKECKTVKEFSHLGSNFWVLKEMKNHLKYLTSIVMIEEKEFSPSFEDMWNNLHIVIRYDAYPDEDIDTILEYSKLCGKHPSLYLINTGQEWGNIYTIELSTFMYDNLQRLYFVFKNGNCRIIDTKGVRLLSSQLLQPLR